MQNTRYIEATQVLDHERTVDDATGDVTLEVQDGIVAVDLPAANGATRTVTLPNVSEARGRRYTIHVRTLGGAGSKLHVKSQDDSAASYSVDTFDAVGDRVRLESDGRYWWPLVQIIA